MRGSYKSFKGINLTISERMHQFIMGGGGGAAQSVRGNDASFKGINVTVLERIHQFIMYILYGVNIKYSSICCQVKMENVRKYRNMS